MILLCKDFTFEGKSLSSFEYITASTGSDTDSPISLKREMDTSTMNMYRPKRNSFGVKYSNVLEFDIHIIKDTCNKNTQTSQRFSNEEIEDCVAWLSSPQKYKWLSVKKFDGTTAKVFGYFSDFKPYEVGGSCYGLICSFTANSPFSYTEKTINQNIAGTKNFLLNNESKDYSDYVYPTFHIKPTKNEEIYIHNLSDTEILENGMLNITSNLASNIQLLQSKIQTYASKKNMEVTYMYDETTKDVKVLCDKTVLLFYMTDSYGIKNKYVAYYSSTDKQYFICKGGFFYCKLLVGLEVDVDCENLGIYESLNRPVQFSKLSIEDEDEIYWMRLIGGNNSFRAYGNFELNVKYLEPRKAGLVE